jgi:cytochrome c
MAFLRAPIRFFAAVFGLLVCGQALAVAELDPIAAKLPGADPQRGAKIFLQCQGCHMATPGAAATVGPNLWQVVGRPIASQPGFDYSEGLKSMTGAWDYEALNRYLFHPAEVAPGTRMLFPGVKRVEDRADLIAYLRTLSDNPIALPEPVATPGPVYGGMPLGEGREAVYFTCRACHALDQFNEETLSRDDWAGIIEQMVEKHGMAEPEDWARELMLDYLAANFGPTPEEGWGGLPAGPGREEVFYSCNACHSLMLVTQQGMSRDRWDETLDWMIEEQGMSEFSDDATRALVLDYLSQHYGG